LNIPNIITLTRIAMIPVFMWAVGAEYQALALALFLTASLTDLLDGYLARKMNQVTNFGKLIDPLADKLLVMSALLYLCADGSLHVWMAMIILGREFVITALRVVAASAGRDIAAGWSGKIKTVVQIICVSFMISPFADQLLFAGITINTLAGWLMVAVTAWSGIDYLWKHRGIFGSGVKR